MSTAYLDLKRQGFYESGETKIRRSMEELIFKFENWLNRMEVNYDKKFDEDYNYYIIKEWE